jgi:hypothetical protein
MHDNRRLDFSSKPHPSLLSHGDGVYLMAKPGEFYAIGFDGSGSVVLDASALNGSAI